MHTHPRTHPLVLTVLWMDFVGLGCRERTEWLTRPASADAAAEEEEGEVAPPPPFLFFQLNFLVVLETMPLTFSSE